MLIMPLIIRLYCHALPPESYQTTQHATKHSCGESPLCDARARVILSAILNKLGKAWRQAACLLTNLVHSLHLSCKPAHAMASNIGMEPLMTKSASGINFVHQSPRPLDTMCAHASAPTMPLQMHQLTSMVALTAATTMHAGTLASLCTLMAELWSVLAPS